MADKGNPVITFGTQTYDADDCIQVVSFTHGAEDITYQCGGSTKHIAGDDDATLSFSLALAANDVSKVAALAVGATGACSYYPGGNTTGNIRYSTTKATVLKADIGDVVNKMIVIDVTMGWDDTTVGAAT